MNHRKKYKFNNSNFTQDVVMRASPSDIVGIDIAKAYYSNFLTGFSNIQFTIKDVFGQGGKLVKYWKFKGTHTGNFLELQQRKKLNIDGATLVSMSSWKIAEGRDFYDNYDFQNQLRLIPPYEQ